MTKGDAQSLNKYWSLSDNKHIYIIKELDKHGVARTIGYTRTRNEANLMIYDAGCKLYKERKKYRAVKGNYAVSYSYIIEDDTTSFKLHERSLGYFINGVKIDRFTITLEKVYRTYNHIFDADQVEDKVLENEARGEDGAKESVDGIIDSHVGSEHDEEEDPSDC